MAPGKTASIAETSPLWELEDHEPYTFGLRAVRPRKSAVHALRLLGERVQPHDLTAALGVHRGGGDADDFHHTPTLSHAYREGIRPQVGIGLAVERAAPERGDLLVESLGQT